VAKPWIKHVLEQGQFEQFELVVALKRICRVGIMGMIGSKRWFVWSSCFTIVHLFNFLSCVNMKDLFNYFTSN
jgi:hypothetical protein